MDTKKPTNFPFNLSEVTISGPAGKRVATVLTPKRAMVFDWAQLEKVGASQELSPVERWLIDNAARSGERARITILRAVNAQGERVWYFDPAFDNDELQRAGYILTKALLPFHRALRTAGVMLMVHSDWGDRESYGMREGIWRCVDELTARAPKHDDPSRDVDLWVLKNMVQHMSLSLEHVVQKILPDHLPMIDRRWARIKDKLVTKPPTPI